MYSIFGFGVSSPIEAMDKLALWAKSNKYQLRSLHGNIETEVEFKAEYGNTRILIVSSVLLLTRYRKFIDDSRMFVLLFDTPLLLDQIPYIIPMDYKAKASSKQKREIAFGFKLMRPQYAKLRAAIEDAMQVRNNKALVIKPIKYIPKIVGQLETGCTTNMITDFLYSICSHTDFLTIKRLTFRVLMAGKVTPANRAKMVSHIGTKGYGNELFNRLSEELTSPRAQCLALALREVLDIKAKNAKLAKGTKTTPVVYSKIAKKNKVDTHELKEATRIYLTSDIHTTYTKDNLSRVVG